MWNIKSSKIYFYCFIRKKWLKYSHWDAWTDTGWKRMEIYELPSFSDWQNFYNLPIGEELIRVD